MTFDSPRNDAVPLTGERLLSWTAAKFPARRNRTRGIRIGRRSDVGSGSIPVDSNTAERQRTHHLASLANRPTIPAG